MIPPKRRQLLLEPARASRAPNANIETIPYTWYRYEYVKKKI